eukprot:TRINITY_DN25259_c0_g1_i2.p1 TRINITY_DN25259_c0_g1~~TRINITY_DN25259_c0_g1_i2.p1  ORF type:complete len:133 (-),score=47.40 TRINITY_DN25259_c0_g1_i2:171-569(-)
MLNFTSCVFFFFFSSRRRHTRCREVSWARRCVQETVSTQSTWVRANISLLLDRMNINYVYNEPQTSSLSRSMQLNSEEMKDSDIKSFKFKAGMVERGIQVSPELTESNLLYFKYQFPLSLSESSQYLSLIHI